MTRPSETIDLVTAAPLARLAGLFDHVPPDGELPVLWHWLFHLDTVPQGELGPDGHPRRRGELAHRTLPKRMFAGGQVTVLSPITVGDRLRRTSRLGPILEKEGRHGPLQFVELDRELHRDGDLVLREKQTLVYHDLPVPSRAESTDPPSGPPEGTLVPTPVHLFRLSALTYNSHRIHYDQPYTTAVEGYPDLVVQGPLVALFLAELLRVREDRRQIQQFTFRARSPAYVGDRIDGRATGAGDQVDLTAHVGGTEVMTASASLA